MNAHCLALSKPRFQLLFTSYYGRLSGRTPFLLPYTEVSLYGLTYGARVGLQSLFSSLALVLKQLLAIFSYVDRN